MKSSATTQKLYRALFDISTLRDEIRALSCNMRRTDESRFLLRVDFLEAAAVRLVDHSEQHRRVSSH